MKNGTATTKEATMNIATFRTQVISKWATGWTARKFVNQARKHALRVTTQKDANELDYLVGHRVSQDQRKEFVNV